LSLGRGHKEEPGVEKHVPYTNSHHLQGLLKGHKLEIIVAEFSTQTKPVWVDDLETRK
jgi:hypothetical protein